MASDVNTETQVAHGEQGSGNFPPFDGTTFPSQLLWLAITFGVFYYVMAKVVLPRIGGILEDRRDRIAGDLAEAGRLKSDSDEAIAAYEQALAEARQNAHGIAQATRDKLNAEVTAKRQAAEAELAKKVEKADAQISEIKAEAVAQVGDVAKETAAALVDTLIGGKISDGDVSKAVDAAMKG